MKKTKVAKIHAAANTGIRRRVSTKRAVPPANSASSASDLLTDLAFGLVNRVVASDALLSTCHALAHDMLSCDPEVLRAYKRVIDEGYAATFADGLALEDKQAITRALLGSGATIGEIDCRTTTCRVLLSRMPDEGKPGVTSQVQDVGTLFGSLDYGVWMTSAGVSAPGTTDWYIYLRPGISKSAEPGAVR